LVVNAPSAGLTIVGAAAGAVVSTVNVRMSGRPVWPSSRERTAKRYVSSARTGVVYGLAQSCQPPSGSSAGTTAHCSSPSPVNVKTGWVFAVCDGSMRVLPSFDEGPLAIRA
jgi:hypothetical protein